MTTNMPAYLPTLIMVLVLALLAFFVIKGYRKGLLRILFTTFSIIITIILAALFARPLADLLERQQFPGEYVEKKVAEYVNEKTEDLVGDTASAREGEFIDSLALPGIIKDHIKDSNVVEKYTTLGVKTFQEYMTMQLSGVIINAMSFILLMIVIYLILRIILHIVRFIQKIPIIRGVNRLLGAVLGLAEGMLILWIICVVIMIFSGSQFGTDAMAIIRANRILSLIYDNNYLIIAAKAIFKVL